MKYFLYEFFVGIPNEIYRKPETMNKYFYWILISIGSWFDIVAGVMRILLCFGVLKALMKRKDK